MASWIFFGLAWLSLLINHSIDLLEQINAYFKHQWSGRRKEEGLETQCRNQDKQADKDEESHRDLRPERNRNINTESVTVDN